MTGVLAWALERLPPAVFAPVVVALTTAALWVAPPRSWYSAAASAVVATLTIVSFRLWDDIEDAARDRAAFPGRVLPNAARAPFEKLLLTLAVCAAACSATRAAALAALLLAALWMHLGYRWIRPHLSDGVWRYAILLSKYPAFVGIAALVSGEVRAPRLGVAASAAYACAAVYEWAHHDRLLSGAQHAHCRPRT